MKPCENRSLCQVARQDYYATLQVEKRSLFKFARHDFYATLREEIDIQVCKKRSLCKFARIDYNATLRKEITMQISNKMSRAELYPIINYGYLLIFNIFPTIYLDLFSIFPCLYLWTKSALKGDMVKTSRKKLTVSHGDFQEKHQQSGFSWKTPW